VWQVCEDFLLQTADYMFPFGTGAPRALHGRARRRQRLRKRIRKRIRPRRRQRACRAVRAALCRLPRRDPTPVECKYSGLRFVSKKALDYAAKQAAK